MQNKPDMSQVASVIQNATLLEEIGEGGYKVVYRAEFGGRQEALKLVRIPTDPQDPNVREENIRRIKREINILGKCSSDYLVRLGSLAPVEVAISSESYVAYSEELIEGESLSEKIRSGHQPTQEELARVGLVLLDAIAELSRVNVIHRDIKPGNIMATSDNDRPYVLLDLGIAFIIGETHLTQNTYSVPGTLYYTAPEMLELNFRQSLDYRADLYTTGLTLYEYASGCNPFARRGDPQYTTLYRIKNEQAAPLSKARSDLNPAFCRLVDQLLKKLPALRPANIESLIKQVEGYA